MVTTWVLYQGNSKNNRTAGNDYHVCWPGPPFMASEPPKVVRTPIVLNILTSKCASRHNGVCFFDISTSKSGPNP